MANANQGDRNARFIETTDEGTRQAVLSNIGAHYGMTEDDVYEEIIHDEAEMLADYITGPLRFRVYALMQRRALA